MLGFVGWGEDLPWAGGEVGVGVARWDTVRAWFDDFAGDSLDVAAFGLGRLDADDLAGERSPNEGLFAALELAESLAAGDEFV